MIYEEAAARIKEREERKSHTPTQRAEIYEKAAALIQEHGHMKESFTEPGGGGRICMLEALGRAAGIHATEAGRLLANPWANAEEKGLIEGLGFSSWEELCDFNNHQDTNGAKVAAWFCKRAAKLRAEQ